MTVCEKLGCRDKLRLAQLLIQSARKEKKDALPGDKLRRKQIHFLKNKSEFTNDSGSIVYVAKEILRLKPTKKKSLRVSIKAMSQIQGGISDSDEKKIISALPKHRYIKIDTNNYVTYP